MKPTVECPNCWKVYEPELGERKHPELLIQEAICHGCGDCEIKK